MTARTRPVTHLSLAAVVVMAVVLGLAGCSSSGSGANRTGTTSRSTTGSTSTAAGSPINVGYSNTEGKGAISVPTVTVGVELAIAWINNHGGVHGHPLKLDKCLTDGTPASSLSCANSFVQHKDPVVLSGLDLGVDAMVPVLDGAGIPAFALEFQGQKAAADSHFFQVGPPLVAISAIPLVAFAQAHKNSVAFADIEAPATHQSFANFFQPLATRLGMQASLVTYNIASPSYSSVVATLVANRTDAVAFFGPEDACTGFVNAATSSGGYHGLINLGPCTQFVDKFGGRVAGVETIGFLYPPTARDAAPPAKQAQIDQYLNDVKQAGDENKTDVQSLGGYASVIDLADVLKTVPGDVTPARVEAAFKSLSGFDGFDGDTLDCANRAPSQGAACDNKLLVLQVKSDGSQAVVGDGYTAAPHA